MRNTPRPILLRALQQCRTNITRALRTEDDFGNDVREVAGLVRATDGDRFAIIMFYEPDKRELATSKVWTHCSCPFYTFHNEVVNSLRKSSDVINSNGELPIVRNPRMIPYLCKHLVALAKIAVVVKVKPAKIKKAGAPAVRPVQKVKPVRPAAVPPAIPRPGAVPRPAGIKPIARPGQPGVQPTRPGQKRPGA